MKSTVAVFLFALLALSASAIAGPVDISVSNANVILQSGDTQAVNVTVTNNLANADTFSISIFPSFLQGITTSLTKTSVTLQPQATETVTLYFTSPFDVQQFVSIFSVTARSFSNTNIQASKDIVLQSVRRSPVYISDIKLSSYTLDPQQNVVIEAKLSNLDTREYKDYMLMTVVKKGDTVLQRFDNAVGTVAAKSTSTIVNTYAIGKFFQPGDYVVQSTLKDSLNNILSANAVQFRVNAVSKLPADYTKKTISVGFLSYTTTIVVTNDGNVASPSFYITESLLGILDRLFTSNPAPSSSEASLSNVIYKWYVPTLDPGQSVQIQYQISLIPIWITLFLIAIIVYFAYVYTFKPAVVKSHRHFGPPSKEREIPVLVEIKNRSVHEIKDIVIVDRVPQLAQLVEKFDTLRPKVKKVAGGAELVWRFDSLKPREERVLTYRIRPTAALAELHLPHAVVAYVNRKKEKKVITSRKIIVK